MFLKQRKMDKMYREFNSYDEADKYMTENGYKTGELVSETTYSYNYGKKKYLSMPDLLDEDDWYLHKLIYEDKISLHYLKKFFNKKYRDYIANVFESDDITLEIFTKVCYDPLDFDFLIMMKMYLEGFISNRTFAIVSLMNVYPLIKENIFSFRKISKKNEPLKMEYKVITGEVMLNGNFNNPGVYEFLGKEGRVLLYTNLFKSIEVLDDDHNIVDMNHEDLIASEETLGWYKIIIL